MNSEYDPSFYWSPSAGISVAFWRDPDDGGFVGYHTDDPGIASQGETVPELLFNLRLARMEANL